MIGKVLETLFRHLRLILLPLGLIPLLVTPIAFFTARPEYEAGAAIWVDRASYLGVQDDWNRYLPPSQNQANRIRELLGTRNFLTEVAKQTALAPLVGTQRGEQQLQETVFRGLKISPSGEHVIGVSFRSVSPPLSLQVVQALIETYRQKSAADSANQASVSTSFYESALQQAEDERSKTRDSLRRYVATNPRLSGIDPVRGSTANSPSVLPIAASDPQLAELLSRLALQDSDTDKLRSSLQQVKMNIAALQQGQDLSFQIVDQPRLPTEATLERKKLLIFPVAGLLAGLAISAVLLVVLTAIDRSVRTKEDLGALDARLLGSIPLLRPQRRSKRRDSDIVRRLVGQAAGIPLPAAERVS